jgi:hypothetical protein
MTSTEDLREQSRNYLKRAMQKTSRVERHRLARLGLALAKLANDVDAGKARMEDSVKMLGHGRSRIGIAR